MDIFANKLGNNDQAAAMLDKAIELLRLKGQNRSD